MKSTTQKGRDFQNWIEKWILKHYPNCLVHNQKPVATRINVRGKDIWVSKRNDLFGLFDLCILVPNEMPVLIQATTHTTIGDKLKQIDAALGGKNIIMVRIQVWHKRQSGKVVIYDWGGYAGSWVIVGEMERAKYEKVTGDLFGETTTD